MNPSLEVGNIVVDSENVFSILAEKQMIIPLAKEILLDKIIEDIECTSEEVTMAEQQFFAQIQINPNDQERLQMWLNQNYLTREQLQKRILRNLKLERYKEKTWGEELESYYLKRKRQLDKVLYSLIRTKNVGEAQELYFRIIEGEKEFSEVAKEYSQGSEAQTGGLIGPIELNVPHPEISQRLMTSQPGQVLPPCRIGDWIVILRLEKYISAQLDQNLKRRLLDELFNAWLSETLQKEVKFNFVMQNV